MKLSKELHYEASEWGKVKEAMELKMMMAL